MHQNFDLDHFTFLNLKIRPAFEKLGSSFAIRQQLTQQLWQQLGYYEACSMHWKFNFDHFTFLTFENPSSCSKVRWQFWQQLCFQLAAVGAALVAAWLLGSSSMRREFNSDHLTFLKFENPSSNYKLSGSFGNSFAIGQQLSQQLWQQLGY